MRWFIAVFILLLTIPKTTSALDLTDVYIRQASPVDSGEVWIDLEDEAGALIFDDARIRDNSEAMNQYVVYALEGKKKLKSVRLNSPPYISWFTIEPQDNKVFQYFLVGLAGILCGAFYVYAILSNMK